MSKKLVLRLSAKHSLEINSLVNFRIIQKESLVNSNGHKHETKSWADLIPLLDRLGFLAICIFLLLLFSGAVIGGFASSIASLKLVYLLVVVLLFLQTLKVILSSAYYLPSVINDLLILIFTTVVSVVIFLANADQRAGNALWGNEDLLVLSSISVIAFWFFYYLFVINSLSFAKINKYFMLLGLSPIVAFGLSVFAAENVVDTLGIVMALLLPGWIILAIFEDKYRNLYIVDALLSSYVLLNIGDRQIYSTLLLFMMLFVGFILVAFYKNINERVVNFRATLSEVLARKSSFEKLLQAHSIETIVTVMVLVFLISSLYLRSSEISLNFFSGISASYSDLTRILGAMDTQEKVMFLLIGEGLRNNENIGFVDYIRAYGLLGTTLILVILGSFVALLMKRIREVKDSMILGRLVYILSIILVYFASIFVFSNITRLVVFVWTSIAILAVIEINVFQNKTYELVQKEREFLFHRKLSNERLVRSLQFVLIALAMIGSCYLFAQIIKIEDLLF